MDIDAHSPAATPDTRGLFTALVADGRPLLSLTALGLLFSGLFALFLAATGHFLPHDVAYLGMTAAELCALNECRVVHFMMHDRVSFGGALIAIAALYFWLAEFPLRAREPWAWWAFLISGSLGFASFLTYLGYGYLDTWHGAATLVLLPCFVIGLICTGRGLPLRRGAVSRPAPPLELRTRLGRGRVLLLLTGLSLLLGGGIILTVGVTTVFVPQDLEYMGLSVADLRAANPRLVPLIAHDRAGFGGGVACCGLTMVLCVRRGTPSRALWQALFVSGAVGFTTAIGVHPLIGYNSITHLAPACIGAAMFAAGITMTHRPMCRRK